MSDDLEKTIKIRINEKAGTDSRGRTVWTKPIEPVELELLSTQTLEKILHSDDENRKKQLHALAECDDGVIACDTARNRFEILRDDELERALQQTNDPTNSEQPSRYTLEQADSADGSATLSLVTTQVLRKILDNSAPDDPDSEIKGGGYNPYDKS